MTLTLIIAVVAGLGAGILAGFMVARSRNRPLDVLLNEVRDVARADHLRRLSIEDADDPTGLARAFNAVIDGVIARRAGVRETGNQVAASAASLAASATELEATMNEQVASTTQVMASAKAISSTGQGLAVTMGEVAGLAQAAAASADQGREDLARMSDAVRHMEEASRSISDKLEVMNSRATNITGVVTTIAKIADQTNLLSLNAAIEAAKAGEAGQGFSIVAREIRRLADKTAVATLDIERMVKEMQTAVATGVMSMEKFSDEVRRAVQDVGQVGTRLTRITEQVHALTPRFESVTQGMDQQSAGAAQISEAMVQLNEATRHTADALRESRQAIDRLQNVAHGLERKVVRPASA
jgi:methyl-accepting chemotaxis protein WspA